MSTEANGTVVIDGHSLTIEQVVTVARGVNGVYPQVMFDPGRKEFLAKQRAALERLIALKKVMYGVNTGCGSNKHRVISDDELLKYQHQYIEAHACGVGAPLPKELVRAMMILRVNSFAVGNSAMTVALCQRILDLLNLDIVPMIPEFGSVGASGDLIPLAHLGAVLIGLPAAMVLYQGQVRSAVSVLDKIKMKSLVLQPKEAMGLTNGATLILATAVLGYHDAKALLSIANITTALGLEAIRGEQNAFDERIHKARNQDGQIAVAAEIRGLIAGSRLMTEEAQSVCIDESKQNEWKKDSTHLRVQDAYSTRCVPQAHGAVWDALDYLRTIVERELNSSTDNPLLFQKGKDDFEVLSGGNFHGDTLAIPLEAAGIALAKLASISGCRQLRLLSSKFSQDLPPDLSGRGANNDTGFMITQYMSASRVNAACMLANPAATINVPTSGLQEDYVSMGSNSAWKLRQILENVEYVLANELLLTCQGISLVLRKMPSALKQLGVKTERVFYLVRSCIPVVDADRELKPLLDKAVELVRSRRVLHVLDE